MGLSVQLDFNHYQGEQNTDNGDFMLPLQSRNAEVRVDVKGSSHFAQWLLIEDYKFRDRDTKQLISDAFVMVCFDDSFPGNKVLRENPEIILGREFYGEVKGWAKASDFFEPGNSGAFWFEWSRLKSFQRHRCKVNGIWRGI